MTALHVARSFGVGIFVATGPASWIKTRPVLWYKNWSSRCSLCHDDASLMFPRVQAATELATFGVVQAATELAGEGGTDMVQSFLGLESNWLGSRACGQNGYGEW